MTVWKFSIPIADIFELQMPRGAQPLAVQVQDGSPVMWALCDPREPRTYRRFRLAGTGHNLGEFGKYVGTFQLGGFVGHVFDLNQQLAQNPE